MPTQSEDKKRCDASGKAYAGSQRQIQFYVNEQPAILNRAIEEAFGHQFRPKWVSPLKAERYREYKDLDFLEALGMGGQGEALKKFWPNGGPRWDALAVVESQSGGVLLVEAKSHLPEMYSGQCKATSPNSLRMIDKAIAKTKNWLNVESLVDSYLLKGRERKGHLYQLANRLAHLYFFREVLGIDAWLINLCFVDDPHSLTTQREWEFELAQARKNLGLASTPYMADVLLAAK
jgi:hypothetical protein